jgi:hypothetical protein
VSLFLAEINFDIFKNVILFKCSIYVLLRFTQSNMEVVIGDHYFELKIEKDKVGFDDNGDEVELDFGGSGEDGAAEEDENADWNVTRAKPDDAIEEDNISAPASDAPREKSLGNNPSLENKLKAMANSIIDLVVNNVLLECADKVLAEDVNSQFDGMLEEVVSDIEVDLLDHGDVEVTVAVEPMDASVLGVEVQQGVRRICHLRSSCWAAILPLLVALRWLLWWALGCSRLCKVFLPGQQLLGGNQEMNNSRGQLLSAAVCGSVLAALVQEVTDQANEMEGLGRWAMVQQARIWQRVLLLWKGGRSGRIWQGS